LYERLGQPEKATFYRAEAKKVDYDALPGSFCSGKELKKRQL
jgi:hypothetical protein